MKRRITPHLTVAALAGISLSFAQESPRPEAPRPPDAPPPVEQRPPLPPQELRDRPPREVDRSPGGESFERPDRPDRPDRRGPGRPGDEDRRPGAGERRGEGPRGFGEGLRIERYREQRREFPEREQERKPTPYLGVVTVPAPPFLSLQLGLEEGFGLIVENVLPESPAQSAGVQRYDVLKLLNDQQLMSPDQLSKLVQRLGKDADATLTIVRKGQEQKLTIKVGEKMLPARGNQDGTGFRGFGMGGFDRTPDRQQLEEMRRRMQEMGNRESGDPMRGVEERLRAMQEKVRGYQESMRRYQEQMREWQKNPSAEPPQMPPFPELPAAPAEPGRPGQPGVRPADLLRELRPGDRPGVRTEFSEGTSRWDASRARMVMRDADGELEVSVKDGSRVLTIKNPQGKVVFTGPVDSAEQRAAIPEQYRGKLAAMAPPPPSPRSPGEPDRPQRLPHPPVLIEREPGVQ